MSSPFIPRAVWERGSVPLADDAFSGGAWIGLDLSSRNDLTALVVVGASSDGSWDVACEFFAPEQGLYDRAHRDRVPYDVWAREGYLTLTPGSSVDYAIVAARLIDWYNRVDVREFAFDRWRMDVLMAEVARLDCELPLVPFGQGFKDMTPALDALEFALLEGKLRHAGNPVLRMCAANAVVTRDPAGNRKLDKAKATGRIDGLVALAMAMARASVAQPVSAFVSGNLVLI